MLVHFLIYPAIFEKSGQVTFLEILHNVMMNILHKTVFNAWYTLNFELFNY